MTSDIYTSHPLHTVIGLILARRENPEFGVTSLLENPAFALHRDRIFAVARVLERGLRETPAALASIPLMNQMEQFWRAVLSELQAFQDDQELGHLSTAASYIDSHIQVPLAHFLLGNVSNAKSAALPAIMEQQTRFAQETATNFLRLRDESQTLLESLHVKVNHIEQKLREADERLTENKIHAENAVHKLEQIFEEHEKLRFEKNKKTLNTFREDLQAFDEEAKIFNEHHVAYLQEKKDEAARLVELIGTIGATGNYQKIANAETKQADIWRRITVAFFGAGVTLAIATFAKHWSAEVDSESAISILVKLLYAVVITTPAWYAAKESARHRTLADRARQAELELASLGPFIELMPEPKKVEIREHLAKLYFGRSVDTHSVDALLDGKTIKELFVEFFKSTNSSSKE